MEQGDRIALVGIIIEDKSCALLVNQLLHEYGQYVVGRMGLPYDRRQLSIISLVMDAPQDKIAALSGKLGKVKGVSVQVMYSKKS